jgi:hypothetical protein
VNHGIDTAVEADEGGALVDVGDNAGIVALNLEFA